MSRKANESFGLYGPKSPTLASIWTFLFFYLFPLFIYGQSQCLNGCSGKGICNPYFMCDCYEGYFGIDCSQRVCPKGPAVSDVASSDTTAHALVECSAQGKCDYTKGQCVCNDGFTGNSCNRITCFNGCSGHGTCMSLRTAATENDGYTMMRSTEYNLWDADLMNGCKCDYGWSGADCSQKSCEYGVDPRLSDSPKEKVTLVCDCTAKSGCSIGRFKLKLFGHPLKTWLTSTSTVQNLLDSILSSPYGVFQNNNRTLARASVDTTKRRANETICLGKTVRKTTVIFTRNHGDIPALSFYANTLGSGVMYFETSQTLQCNCLNHACNGTFRLSFEGEMSPRISSYSMGSDLLSAIKQMRTVKAYNFLSISSSASGTAICISHQINNYTLTFKGPLGNAPRLELWTSVVNPSTSTLSNLPNFFYSTQNTSTTLRLISNDGRDDGVRLCNGVGRCDFATGSCGCPYGFGFDPNYGVCGAVVANTSRWVGIARCPGIIDATAVGAPVKSSKDDRSNYAPLVYVSVNPTSDLTLKGAIYTFPWLPNSPVGAAFDFQSQQLFLNLTSALSAGPIVLDQALDRIIFVDAKPHDSFFAFADTQNNLDGNYTIWYRYKTYTIFSIAFDAHFKRRRLYWSVPGIDSTSDGNIYYGHVDEANPTIRDLASVIGQDALWSPYGLAIHYVQNRIFWLDRNDTLHMVLRSSNFDGTDYRQNLAVEKVGNVMVSLASSDLIIDFSDNNTAFFADLGTNTGIARLIQVNLDAPIVYDRTVRDQGIFETYVSPRVLNTTNSKGMMMNPTYFMLDEPNKLILYADADRNNVGFTRYRTLAFDPKGKGVAWDGQVAKGGIYVQFTPYGMAMDRGLGRPRWGIYADCYGNGICKGLEGNFVCECNPGFSGDCQAAECPKGKPWFSEPIADNIAHDTYAECSNMGTCDRVTGLCTCRPGFEGAACERMSCPADPRTGYPCYNKGRCLSMRQMSQQLAVSRSDLSRVTTINYGVYPNNANSWDADMIHGCVADRYGWYNGIYNITSPLGTDLDSYRCSAGYNSRLGQLRRRNPKNRSESFSNYTNKLIVDTIDCNAFAGYFVLSFQGVRTVRIPAGSSLTQLRDALQALPTVGRVELISWPAGASRICHDLYHVFINVTYTSHFGQTAPLVVSENKLSGHHNSVTIRRVQFGTMESVLECSGFGKCDRSNGICQCMPGYGPSDGLGNQGFVDNCGYNYGGYPKV